MTKTECQEKVFDLINNKNKKLTVKMLQDAEMYYFVTKYWGGITGFKKEFGFSLSQEVYNKENLIPILKKFYEEYKIIPTSLFMEKHSQEYNLPSRKTFETKLGMSWFEILEMCGLDPRGNNIKSTKIKPLHDDKDFLINIIYEYIEENGKIPTLREINEYYGKELKVFYKRHFGGWNNCLKELGLKLNSVSQYTDEELEHVFMDFVREYNRVPSIKDFNATGRPSFWVYQHKFGSLAEACMHYGFKPNCREEEYYMSDGERCDSSYEYDISTWLKSHNIKYRRNVSYMEVDNKYHGKMNCDYVFDLENGETWYVEMAGFIRTDDFNKLKDGKEQMYYFKIKYKKKLLKRNNANYRIITVNDFKKKSLYELFDFLNLKEDYFCLDKQEVS